MELQWNLTLGLMKLSSWARAMLHMYMYMYLTCRHWSAVVYMLLHLYMLCNQAVTSATYCTCQSSF